MTSNVNISLADTPGGPARSRPIGARYARFTTPHQNLTIQAYGVLFDFRLAAQGITVQDPVAMAREPWFLASLQQTHVDAFVIAGHMPVSGSQGWDVLHAAIRRVWPTTPILMFAGHTHVRDCRMLDQRAMALESGRYLETIGWMSVQNVSASTPQLARRYIDANPRNFAFHAGLTHAGGLSTDRGRYVRAVMDRVAHAWNLTLLFGLVPRDYYLDRYPANASQSLLALMAGRILPDIVRPANARHTAVPTLLLLNSGSQRFDVLAGPFTKNDQYITSPFPDLFQYVADVPWHIAKTLVHGLSVRGTPHDTKHSHHPAQGAVDSIFHRYLGRQWRAYWTKQLGSASSTPMPPTDTVLSDLEASQRLDTSQPSQPSLGYVTVDGCDGPGDDTVHTPVPYAPHQPEYIASTPTPEPEDGTLVDVVFVDFILPPLLDLLNLRDPNRTYTPADAQPWGNVSTQWLYPLYAEHAWQPKDIAAAWKAMDAASRKQGYPPLAMYDASEQDPYEMLAGAHTPPLVFQT